MLNTVKEIIYTVGDSTGSFAKSVGLTSADLAKTIGTRSVKIAKDIGPKRAIIGAAILAVAIGGGIVLVRYLRRRDERDLEPMDASDAEGHPTRSPKVSRAERRAQHAAQATR